LGGLHDSSYEIGINNRFVFRYFFVNYGFDRKEIISIDSMVCETLTATTVADTQRRAGIIAVVVFCAIIYSYFFE